MSIELKKRIVTSIILSILLIIIVFSHIGIFTISTFIVSYFIYNEVSLINYRILKNKAFILNIINIFYIFGVFLPSAIVLYKLTNPLFILYVLLVCISSDIGGYFIGKNIGGAKLTKISPNKTISGSLGSFFFSFLPLLIFVTLNNHDYYYSINNFLFCLQISLVCQLGDLFISYLKRKAKVKDTGKILPGHGGLLDRIDGIIFAIPFTYFYVTDINDYFKYLF